MFFQQNIQIQIGFGWNISAAFKQQGWINNHTADFKRFSYRHKKMYSLPCGRISRTYIGNFSLIKMRHSKSPVKSSGIIIKSEIARAGYRSEEHTSELQSL